MKKTLLPIIILLLFTLTGCPKYNDVSLTTQAVSLGIDYQDEQFVLTVQIINHNKNSTAEIGSTLADTSSHTTATNKGDTINQALDKIRITLLNELQLSFTESIVIHKNVIENEKLEHIIETILDSKELMPTLNIFLTEENIESIYTYNNLNNSSTYFSSLLQPNEHFEKEGLIKPITFVEIIRYYNEQYYNTFIPTVKIDDETWTENEENIKMLYIDGACTFDKLDMKACYTTEKNKGIKYLFKNPELSQTDNDNEIDFELLNSKPTLTIKNDKYVFKYTALLKLKQKPQDLSNEQAVKNVNEYIKEQILEFYEQNKQNGIDVLNLDDYSYRRNKLDTHNFSSSQLDVVVNVKL